MSPLLEVALLFLRLGATAFGGPAAHLALMEDEVVKRRGWLTREAFLDLLGATNLIPGPNSTEMAIHLGYLRAGWPGLVVGGACFILPAMAIVMAIAWAYVRYGALPVSTAILYGVKPIVVAIVVQALVRLARTAVKTWRLGIIAAAAVTASFLGVNELIVLAVAGILAVPRSRRSVFFFAPAVPAAAVPFGLAPLFLFFLKVGAILFGSGYVLVAFLRADLVVRWHWLTEGQLLDAVAVGQITPGPVFTTATFIGYILGGPGAALVATLGIFLPAFVFVALSGPFVPRLRKSAWAGAFLDGVNVGSLALMAAVAVGIGQSAVVDWPSALLLAGSVAVLLLVPRLSSSWLLLAGALVGLSASYFR